MDINLTWAMDDFLKYIEKTYRYILLVIGSLHLLSHKHCVLQLPARFMGLNGDLAGLKGTCERRNVEGESRQEGSSHVIHPFKNMTEIEPRVFNPSNSERLQGDTTKQISPDRISTSALNRNNQDGRKKLQESSIGAARSSPTRKLEPGFNDENAAAHNEVGNGVHSILKQQKPGIELSLDGNPRNNIGAKSASKDEPDIYKDLRELISSFGSGLQFEVVPENGLSDCYLNRLPDEVLILVLQYLEPVYVERFALVCKKARILTLDSNVWMCVRYMQS